jgi:hypothetical protein
MPTINSATSSLTLTLHFKLGGRNRSIEYYTFMVFTEGFHRFCSPPNLTVVLLTQANLRLDHDDEEVSLKTIISLLTCTDTFSKSRDVTISVLNH